MGFLSRRPAAPLDPALEALFIGGCQEKELSAARKALASQQEEVLRVLDASGDGEEPHLLACDTFSGLAGRGFLLVTSERSVQFGPFRALHHRDVAATTLGRNEYGRTIVFVHSHRSRLDFRPNDDRRFEHMIVFSVETPRVANRICQAIDQHLG